VFGLLAAAHTGCASDKAVIGQANQFHTGLQPAVMDDPELTDYIQRVGQRIISAAADLDRQGYGPKAHKEEKAPWMFSDAMKFHFVNSKTLNAFTTGGEHMYIYNELFQSCKSEDELAAVMAHEYGHVYGRHVHKGMNRQMALLLGAGAAGAAGYAAGGSDRGGEYAGYGAGLAMMAGQVVNMGFGRNDEKEADKLGFDFYVRAGYDPERFGDFFRTMIQKAGNQQGAPEFLSSHPTLASRVEEAERRAAEWERKGRDLRRPPVADAREFRQLQNRAAQVGQRTPTDETLANSKELLQALPRSCLLVDQPSPPDAEAARQNLMRKADRQEAAAQPRQSAQRQNPQRQRRSRDDRY
jgi:predicted Zn-dependent protease